MAFEVDPSQYDHKCYIVAGGPSLKGFDWRRLGPDKFVVAINRSYEVLPEAQVVYFTDHDFWIRHQKKMIQHKGQLIRGMVSFKNENLDKKNVIYYQLTGRDGLETREGKLKHGSNSTYAATNLAAVHWGFKKIYLLGVDMKWGSRGDRKTSHWHSGHRRIDNEATYRKMMQAYKTIAEPLKTHGVQVFNANPDSALNVFPKITLEEAVDNG